MKKPKLTIIFALLFTVAVLVLGYVMLGLLPMILFAFGFLGGFILWIIVPTNVSFDTIKIPFYLTLTFFLLHKFEEKYMDFFSRLSEITGVPVPETNSLQVYLLYSFAGAWLLIPYLVKRHYIFGYYLSWTFFTSMGVIELAHFLFPFFTPEPYGYFPGMVSVTLLAPVAWWGMYKLSGKSIYL
ncbi:hypothetical protein [Emticicia sp. TH156]|uniref:hypothetical protein n=1 Tax=Emticicia sp. TH156 TaxID=2067454 RepID=UPI000C79407E|nr:hypothetical protein [Emticicia sp. TH156]PLK44884.1 hypothetical protein C0V77_06445 [Emticicia sp. TH156]